MDYCLQMFGFSLGLTLLTELTVGWCFGLRAMKQIRLLILVNLLTNPAAVWLHSFWRVPQLSIEIAVVIIEYYVYRLFRTEAAIAHPLALSLTANGISWGLGIVLQLV